MEIMSATLTVDPKKYTRLANRIGHQLNGFGVCVGYGQNGGRLTLCIVDGCQLCAFRPGNKSLALASGNINLLLPAAF